MLETVFMQVLSMTKTATIVIVAVLMARWLLKKAPKIFSYALWLVVLFRLLCPVSIESPVSIVPSTESLAEVFAKIYTLADRPITTSNALGQLPSSEGKEAWSEEIRNTKGVKDAEEMRDARQTDVTPWEAWTFFGKYLWLAGMAGMLLYSMAAYVKLRKKLIGAVPLKDNIYAADHIDQPFVSGLFRPRIYLPSSLKEKEQEYILLHERHHIRRLDHVMKLLAFLALSIHWFHPLVWVAFMLFGKDMEMSCDEAVVKKMGADIRADYSASLLYFATGRQMIAGTPLAFGEGNIKGRIRNLAHARKPAAWMMLLAAIACAAVAICLMTNPQKKQDMLFGANYSIAKILYDMADAGEELGKHPLQYCITADYHLYVQQKEGESWKYLGVLESCSLTKEELKSYAQDGWLERYRLRDISDAYALYAENGKLYLAMQTEGGDTLLGCGYAYEQESSREEAEQSQKKLEFLYLLKSSFTSGYVNSNFFERSLTNTVENPVYCFAHFESDNIPGYHIVGFQSGKGSTISEMTDMGFAVFQTTGEGYRLIDWHVYPDAALCEHGIYFCEHPAVADVNGRMTDKNTFDVILICGEEVGTIERVYHVDKKEDKTRKEIITGTHDMSLWAWSESKGYAGISQYFYDKEGNLLSADSVAPKGQYQAD